jgi:hypothetical protein
LSRLTAPTRLLLGLALATFVVSFALAALSERSVVDEWWLFAHGTQGVDSWRPMNQASLYLEQAPEKKPLYAWLFFERKVKFIYPPTSLLFVDAVRSLAPSGALQTALNLVSWLLVVLTAGLTAALADRVLARGGAAPADAVDRGVRAALVFVLTLACYPVLKAYTLGQMQVFVNAAFAGFLLCWVTDRRASAGVLTVLMAVVKPQYGALLLWGVIRREWSFVGAAAISGMLVLLLSIGLYGFASHVDYLSVVSHVGRLGEAYWPNQTINGLLQRALGNGNSAVWDPHVYPPYHGGIHAATWASTALVIGLACFGRARPAGSTLDVAAVVLAATLGSPIAWEHHYGVLPPLFVVLALPCARHFGRRGALLLAAGFVVASQYWHPLDALTDTSWNVLQSLLLFVGLGLFVALLRLRVGAPLEDASAVRNP